MDGQTRFAWMARTISFSYSMNCAITLRWPTTTLLTCDDESHAETLCAWWQIASPILARLLIAQHRCGLGVGCDHQEGRLALARRAVDTVDGPWPSGIGDTLALRREQPTKGLRLHTGTRATPGAVRSAHLRRRPSDRLWHPGEARSYSWRWLLRW